jgi:hypothetical protein
VYEYQVAEGVLSVLSLVMINWSVLKYYGNEGQNSVSSFG